MEIIGHLSFPLPGLGELFSAAWRLVIQDWKERVRVAYTIQVRSLVE